MSASSLMMLVDAIDFEHFLTITYRFVMLVIALLTSLCLPLNPLHLIFQRASSWSNAHRTCATLDGMVRANRSTLTIRTGRVTWPFGLCGEVDDTESPRSRRGSIGGCSGCQPLPSLLPRARDKYRVGTCSSPIPALSLPPITTRMCHHADRQGPTRNGSHDGVRGDHADGPARVKSRHRPQANGDAPVPMACYAKVGR